MYMKQIMGALFLLTLTTSAFGADSFKTDAITSDALVEFFNSWPSFIGAGRGPYYYSANMECANHEQSPAGEIDECYLRTDFGFIKYKQAPVKLEGNLISYSLDEVVLDLVKTNFGDSNIIAQGLFGYSAKVECEFSQNNEGQPVRGTAKCTITNGSH
jgi:hypothetical protein